MLEQRRRIPFDVRVKGVRDFGPPFDHAIGGILARIRSHQKGIEVEVVEVLTASAHLEEQIGTPNNVAQRAVTQLAENLAHFLGHKAEQLDDLFRRAGELGPQPLILAAHPDGAGVGVTLADHDAAHGDKAGRSDAELLRAQHGGDDDIAPCAHAAVCTQGDEMAKVVQGQDLIGLRQAHLPGAACIFD